MKAAVLTGMGAIELRDVPRPAVGPGELLVRVRAVGLCGTDVKAYARGHPYFPPPCVLGHEFSGVVEEVGAGVSRFRTGDRVVAAPYVECGACDLCRRGAGELCRNKAFVAGALQEFIVLPSAIVSRATFAIPDDADFAVFALAEPLACVANGLERAGVGQGDTVLVVGGGPMGALLALMARSRTPRVAVSEPSPERRAALARLGLSALDPGHEDLAERLHDLFGVRRADRVLIAVGSKEVAEESLRLVSPAGVGLLFGGLPKGDRVSVDAFAVHYEEVTVAGSFGFRLDQFRGAVEWLERHAADVAPVMSSEVPLRDAARAFAAAARGDGLKTVIVLGDDDAE